MAKPLNLLLILLLGTISMVYSDPVHILSPNLDQPITSSTLQWVSSDGQHDVDILKNAVVAAYQTTTTTITGDEGDEENDVMKSEEDPIYVCRVKVTGIWIAGQIRSKNFVCIASLFSKVQEYHQFEILINIDDSARLSWVEKTKFQIIPHGAVCSGDSGRSYVARTSTKNTDQSGDLTHFVGICDPSENLGVYRLVDKDNNEVSVEDGEILIETEPTSYELRQIHFKHPGRRFPKTKQILAQAVLKNDANGLQKVESVMSYNYSYFLSWGKGHGMLTGLNFTVFLPTGKRIDDTWALPKAQNKIETVPVQKYLEEGTAINVTLVGYFQEPEIPYTATVVAIYSDQSKREFAIEDIQREKKYVDVKPEFGPVYFIHNNSFVPTTTTTTTTTTTSTTSTTSTTTTAKTTSSTNADEPKPISSPEVIMQNIDNLPQDEGITVQIAESLNKKPEASSSSLSTLINPKNLNALLSLMNLAILFVTFRLI